MTQGKHVVTCTSCVKRYNKVQKVFISCVFCSVSPPTICTPVFCNTQAVFSLQLKTFQMSGHKPRLYISSMLCYRTWTLGSYMFMFLFSASHCPQYGIVLDAGSSHTALYIYKWPADKQNGTGVVTQHRECHVKGRCEQFHHQKPMFCMLNTLVPTLLPPQT